MLHSALMDVLVYEGPREMNMRRAEIPKPEPDEILIRVEKAGICGSELSGYLGHNSLRVPPLVMGHEFAGTVAALGADVSAFRPGDRVTVNPLVSCRRCRSCVEGRPQLCERRAIVGVHRPGAFAEYVAVPAASAYALPGELSVDAATLTEPFACAIHAVRQAGLDPADRLLVYGGGPIGLLVLLAARAFGLERVTVMELNRNRLDIADALGAVAVGSEEALRAAAPAGGYDAVVDAVGVCATRQQSVLNARPGGTVVFSGLHEAKSPLPINVAIRNEVTLKGAFCYDDRDFETALRWLGEGKADLTPWLQHIPLSEGKAGFERLLGDPGPVAKIMLSI
ncbi:alcohol dehydrogenase catalytic domain-containing protein [Paenibacillus sp.]|uniref:zinc-dependent alcohol dehydrogenase n=1 Tax=Paenibacillus sp. TaxID=58172 RepID=UPI002811C177|nr:alcohol dehydrogenase catalytic domain-containing protein [Paenibacillus sp.]